MVLDFIQANPGDAGQIALSFALVFVTAVYTIFTYKQTIEMRKTREVSDQQTTEMQKTRERSNQPVLQGSVITHAPTIVVAEFRNTGNIAAHDVSAKIEFNDLDADPLEFTIPILSPEEDYRFRLPLDNSSKTLWKMDEAETFLETENSSGDLVFEFCFENPFGKEYCRKNVVDVKDWLNNSSYAVGYTKEEKARDTLNDIVSELDFIKKKM